MASQDFAPGSGNPDAPEVLATGAAAAAAGIAGIRPACAPSTGSGSPARRSRSNLIKGPRGDMLQKYHEAEFTELTGIKVASEQIPEQQQRQKAVIELTSGKPSFDVVHLSYHVQKRQFDKAGWLADFSGFIKDPNLTDPT